MNTGTKGATWLSPRAQPSPLRPRRLNPYFSQWISCQLRLRAVCRPASRRRPCPRAGRHFLRRAKKASRRSPSFPPPRPSALRSRKPRRCRRHRQRRKGYRFRKRAQCQLLRAQCQLLRALPLPSLAACLFRHRASKSSLISTRTMPTKWTSMYRSKRSRCQGRSSVISKFHRPIASRHRHDVPASRSSPRQKSRATSRGGRACSVMIFNAPTAR